MVNMKSMMPLRSRISLGLVAVLLLFASPSHRLLAQGAIQYPDLQAVIPLDSLVIGQPTATTRELQYTHHIANLGDGPLEIRPQYNPATDTAQGFQSLYTRDASGNWSLVSELPIVGQFSYHPAHGHYHFPLAYYGIHAVAADGSVGAPLAVSTKVGYCIADDVIEDATVPHLQPHGYWGGTCPFPTATRGISVGWSDVYDSTDAGQSIDITALPDGLYWFRTIVDPYNYLAETDETNNITDLKLQITGTTVSIVGSPAHPSSRPPTVTMSAPLPTTLAGTVTVSAAASDVTGIASVEFLVDGLPIGGSLTAAPYSMSWDSTTIADGVHYVSAQALAASTMYGTAAPVAVTVSNASPPPPPPPPGGLALDQIAVTDAKGVATTRTFSTTSASELLVALVASDGPQGANWQTVAVTGAGLVWNPVARANTANGDTEIWQASTSNPLVNVTVSSQQAFSGFRQSLTVLTFSNAKGVGGSNAASAVTGGPTLSLMAQPGSLVYGVGFDWDRASARTVGTGQALVHQFLDTAVGDTMWVQALTSPTAAAGVLRLNDTAPTTDQWNFAAVEIQAAAVSPPPPPAISNVLVTNRTANSAAVTWTTNVAATSQVQYGPTVPYSSTVSDPTLTTNHSVALSGLTPATTYHYQLTSQDASSRSASTGDFVFTTAAQSQISCSIIAPAANSVVSGSITVSANAGSTASIAGVQFQVDGINLGGEVGGNQTPPYSTTWNTATVSNGTHVLTAVARDPTANTATSSITVTVNNPTTVIVPNVVGQTQAAATTALTTAGLAVSSSTASSVTVPAGSVISQSPAGGTAVVPGSTDAIVVSSGSSSPAISVDQLVASDGHGTSTTPAFTTTAAGEILVAFAASDGPPTGGQSVTISGAGLTWTRVGQANTQLGAAEIWVATATTQLTNVTVQSTQSIDGFDQSLTVIAFAGATGVGAVASGGSATGAPSASLVTTTAGAVVYGVGYDWDAANARVLGAGQVMLHQLVDTSTGDTAWVQAWSGPVMTPGTTITLNDTAPTFDQWNFAILEIVP
jgi:hypothetical protein